jgi:phosphoglycolate phosphatase
LIHKALVLFDIDGTLIRRAGPHHREALIYGIRQVAGLQTTTDGIAVQGMLDPDIVTVMMWRAGASASVVRKALPEICRAAEGFYSRVCPALEDKHCPGARIVLEKLRRWGALLALVTGNLTQIGWRKLERAGLKEFFCFGAFGEMARTRAGLVRLAVREACERGWIVPSTPVSLVGDAPADIRAARENHIRSIAVQTGVTPAGELRAEGPDVLLRDLRALRLHMVWLRAKRPRVLQS